MRVVSPEHFGQRVDDGGIGAAFDVYSNLYARVSTRNGIDQINSLRSVAAIDPEKVELVGLQQRDDRALGQIDAVTSEEGDCDFVHAEALANSLYSFFARRT